MAARVLTYRTTTAAETESVGAELAAALTGGELLAIYGELGAGKTQFVRGLVRALGGPVRQVSSPTYVLLNRYEGGRFAVYHLDAYRVSGPADFEAIGFPEMLEQPGAVVAVEWADRITALLPPKRIDVRIEAIDENRRLIRIEHATEKK